jgi:esterase/lipase
MTPTEIRNEFIKEFLGETLRDWFNKSEVKLKQLSEEFDKVSVDCRDKFAELSSIDRNLSYEIKGRKEEICKELNEAEQNYLRYAKKLLAQFKYLISQKAAYVFPDLFTQLTKTIDAHLSDVKALYEAVCKECKLVTINEKSDINCTKGTEQTAVADSVHSPLS